MPDNYTYRLSESAQEDLNETYDYIFYDLANPDAADSFLDAFEDQIDNICRSPESGFPVNNEFLVRNDVRMFFVKNYTVYYIPDKDKQVILVSRLVYGGMDQNKILRTIR